MGGSAVATPKCNQPKEFRANTKSHTILLSASNTDV